MEKVDCSFLTHLFDSLESALILADSSGCVFVRNKLARKFLGDVTHISQAWSRLQLGPADDGEFSQKSRQAMCKSPFGAQPVRLQVMDLGDSGVLAMVITPAADLALSGPAESKTNAALEISKAAHELNNPLDGIGRFISLAQRAASSDDTGKVTKYLARASEGMEHLKNTLGRMLRSNSPHSHNCDLPENIIQQAIDAISADLELNSVSLICDLQCDDNALIDCDAFGILCNLIKNASQSDSSSIVIRCRNEGRNIIISVTDNGRGVEKSNAEKIFDSFYTTKAAGHGLGLAVSKSSAETLGGSLQYSANPKGGAVFTLTLPQARQSKRQLLKGDLYSGISDE